MNIEEFRDYCMSFKGVTEKMPFGKAASEYDRNLLVFSVLDKWFCFVNIDIFDFCTLKYPADELAELQALGEDIRPAYHMNKKHWTSLYFNRQIDDRRIKEIVRRSYETTVASLSKKQQAQIQTI